MYASLAESFPAGVLLGIALAEFVAVVLLTAVVWWLYRRLMAADRQLRVQFEYARASRAVLQRTSALDALTGVANRRTFDETLGREWERGLGAGSVLSLLLVDIDHFKRHNDEYGHPAGDECLRRVAAVLAAQARRGGDLVARYGGEEFAVLLPGTDERTACVVAERLRVAVAAIELPYKRSATGHAVTVSIGVAGVVPMAGRSSAVLVDAADQALYTAKAVGRNQVIAAATLSAR